jgi:hypothetical protein
MMLILYVSQADRLLCIGRCVHVDKKYPSVQVRWKESTVLLNVTASRTDSLISERLVACSKQ